MQQTLTPDDVLSLISKSPSSSSTFQNPDYHLNHT